METRMFTKALLMTGITLSAVTSSFVAAHGASSGVMTCRPHDWNAFAEAVESQDNEALRAMLSQPELADCDEIHNTVELLVCAADPLACIEPGAGPDPDPQDDPRDDPQDDPSDTEPGEGPFPGQRPGCELLSCGGSDPNNYSDASPTPGGGGGGGGGDGDGGNSPSRGSPSTDNSNH